MTTSIVGGYQKQAEEWVQAQDELTVLQQMSDDINKKMEAVVQRQCAAAKSLVGTMGSDESKAYLVHGTHVLIVRRHERGFLYLPVEPVWPVGLADG